MHPRSILAISAAAWSVCCLPTIAGEPITVDFIADRDAARAGDSVSWTAWIELPDDLPAGSRVVTVDGLCMPYDMFSAQVSDTEALVLRESLRPFAYGAALLGIHSGRNDLLPPFAPSRMPFLSFSTRFTRDARMQWYDFKGTITVFAPPNELIVYARNGPSDAPAGGPIRVRTDRINQPGCDGADLASPWFAHTPTDIVAFTDLFFAGSPIVDYAQPWGLLDVADLLAFFALYDQTCSFEWD